MGQRLEQNLLQTVQAIAMTLETRDPYTAGHQRRVTELSLAIASAMGLDEQQIEGIRFGATIHDIGKIHIPAEILNRPGRLNELEFGLIKTHPEVGLEIVKEIEFPWPVADIIHQHHERLDGSGYPQGLKGDEIILEARILAVADVVEAMSSHRPYRPGLGIEAALDEISKNRGIFYDPLIVDTCIKLFNDKQFAFSDSF
jgi:putative nucleotidyltransferase with HDIG domain